MKIRTYIISGAGSGIGQAIALQITKESPFNRIILLGRNPDKLQAARSVLPNPELHQILVSDLSIRDELQLKIRNTHLEDLNLVGVIANAGIGGENHYGENDRWDEIIATNLTGTYRLIQECLPALRNSSEPFRNIIITSSILGRIGVPGYSAYCASKAGLLGLTRSLAVELASEKILVNSICPGWVETNMAEQGIAAIAAVTGKTSQQERDAQLAHVPLRKMASPQEIAQIVAFLVSTKQTSITGQALDINNGAWMN